MGNDSEAGVTGASPLREDLEANQRRTYPPDRQAGHKQISPATEAVEHAVEHDPMRYGAIKEFQVLSENLAGNVGTRHIVYGLGYDGGVYIWDRERKGWALFNR